MFENAGYEADYEFIYFELKMFFIAVDSSGRLLVENKLGGAGNNQQSKFCLPTVDDGNPDNEVLSFLTKIGFGEAIVVRSFELNLFSDPSLQRKFAIYSISSLHTSESKYAVKSLDEIRQTDVDYSIVFALSKILEHIEHNSSWSVTKLEDKFLWDFNLSQKSNRVFLAKSETLITNKALISFLGAFAVANGEKQHILACIKIKVRCFKKCWWFMPNQSLSDHWDEIGTNQSVTTWREAHLR